MKALNIVVCILLSSTGQSYAQTEHTLYPNGGIPNSKSNTVQEGIRDIEQGNKFIYNTTIPTITSYLLPESEKLTPAVIIFPGGGYAGVSITAEGEKVARAFNEIGVAAFVVKYRTPNNLSMVDKKIGPLQDAEQAMFFVRKYATKWHIDPEKTGVVGFSAGGHLAASLSTRYRSNLLGTPPKTVSLRPSFSILVYPVISMTDSLTHPGSRTNLLGSAPAPSDIDLYSAEKQVDSQTPSTLLIHAGDDTAVKPENSIAYYQALRKNGVSAQLILYPRGGHGFGLENSTTPDRWMDRCRDWMRANKWLF